MTIRLSVAAAVLAFVLTGCAGGPRTFPNTLQKNLNVTTNVDGGSTKVEVAFDIHRLNARCATEFEGRVDLENGSTDVGLPVDEPLYLEFIFVSGGGFTSSVVRATRHGTLFTARSGRYYRAQVSYNKGIYAVEIRETPKGGSGGRVVERVPLSACKART